MMHAKGLLTRSFLITIALVLSIQPVIISAANRPINEQQLLAQILQFSQQKSSSNTFASQAIGSMACLKHSHSIMSSNECPELQIEMLAQKLDKTATSFGSVVLEQSFAAHDNLSMIKKRQNCAHALLDDESLYMNVEQLLKRIKRSEHAMLAYWDASQRENTSKLFARTETFYFSLLQKLFGTGMNSNKWVLEASMIQQMGATGLNLLFYLGLHGLEEICRKWFYGSIKDLNPKKAFLDGLLLPINSFNIFKFKGKDAYKGLNAADYSDYLHNGGPLEIFFTFYHNFKDESTIDFEGLGRVLYKFPDFLKRGWLKDIKKDGKCAVDNSVNDNATKIDMAWNGSKALLVTGAITWYRIAMLWEGLKTTFSRAKNIIMTMKELHVHTIHLARLINSAKNLAHQLEQHPVLGSSCIVEHMNKTIKNSDDELQKLLTLLENNTFETDKAENQIFSRGNVLLAHRLTSRVRDKLVPLLQGIGELDALYAMVTNIKKMADTKTPFSFAEFVPGSDAMINVEDGWLPLVKNVIPNTIKFGADKPNKIVITGPNGGGKSVCLKMLGIITVMAQSWGIVPARNVSMTVFNGLRSCIHPEESLEHELSTFMAEKMRIDEIKQFVFGHKDPQFKVMLLLDEPFRGTVDAESADRIYAFGNDIASLKQSIVMIATHVQKPITLAEHTDGAFANYHVRIKELPNGQFEREFMLEPGILNWWFDDAAKRSRFIDFVTMEKHKERLSQMGTLQNG